MQNENTPPKEIDAANQKTESALRDATCSPSSEVERVMTDKFRDGNDLPALARKHAEQLSSAYDAIRSAVASFERVPWGHDGDCGSKQIIETLEEILHENAQF